jgi:hypothetical protein
MKRYPNKVPINKKYNERVSAKNDISHSNLNISFSTELKPILYKDSKLSLVPLITLNL